MFTLLALLLPLALPVSQDAQARYAEELRAALTAEDERALDDLTGRSPARALAVVDALLREAAFRGPDSEPLRAALRVALSLAEDDPAHPALLAVERFAAMDAEQRAQRRECELELQRAAEAWQRGEPAGTEAAYHRSLELALELEEPLLEASRRWLLGEYLAANGRRVEAVAHLERAMELDRELGHLVALADVQRWLGRIDYEAGRFTGSIRHHEALYATLVELGRESEAPQLELGHAHSVLGSYADARRYLERGLALLPEDAPPARTAWLELTLGQLESASGRYGAAQPRIARALEAFRAGADASGELRALTALGGVYSELGLLDEARDALEEAQRVAARGSPPAERALARIAYGVYWLDAGVPERAREELAPIAAGDDVPAPIAASALRHLGGAYRALGRLEAAESTLRDASAALAELDDPLAEALALSALGDVLAERGHAAEARAAYDTALRAGAGLHTREARWRAWLGLGRLCEDEDRGDAALEVLHRALDEVEEMRGVAGGSSARSRFLTAKRELYARAARLHAERGELAAAFRLSEALKARTLFELYVAPAGVARRPEEPLGRLLELEAALRLCELRRSEAAARGVGVDERARLQDEHRARTAELSRERLRLERSQPGVAAAAGLGAIPGLEQVRAALPERALLLSYTVGAERVLGFKLDRAGARALELGLSTSELEALVARVLAPFEALRAGRLDLATLRFDAAAARELYEALVAPFAAELSAADRLLVAPDGVLHRLPFALLVRAREKRPVVAGELFAQYRGCRFLVEDVAVGTLPAAALLVAPDTVRPGGGPPLALADAEPAPALLSALPGAREELRALQTLLPEARCLVGAEATEQAFLRAASGAAWLHLAVHGELDDRRPWRSRLALGSGGGEDGWLHAYEVERLELARPLVVLPACESLGAEDGGEGLFGLARSFLQAGARSVVASQWLAEDRSSAFLMRRFHAERARGADPARALRAAQLATLAETRGGVHWVHPFFWAGFREYGGR